MTAQPGAGRTAQHTHPGVLCSAEWCGLPPADPKELVGMRVIIQPWMNREVIGVVEFVDENEGEPIVGIIGDEASIYCVFDIVQVFP